ncbi:MAG: 30S ribosomal protein S9 [Bacteroidota bacterium]|nr:30S ribosomal protein S9 [Bacteroidota bacterium]
MEKNVSVGRRKASIARVHISSGKGKITINGKKLEEYFPQPVMQQVAAKPVNMVGSAKSYNYNVNVCGGGFKGQAEAIALGLSRAILLFDEEARPELKSERLLKRDSRVVERKKPGFRKARKKEQYSKR